MTSRLRLRSMGLLGPDIGADCWGIAMARTGCQAYLQWLTESLWLPTAKASSYLGRLSMCILLGSFGYARNEDSKLLAEAFQRVSFASWRRRGKNDVWAAIQSSPESLMYLIRHVHGESSLATCAYGKVLREPAVLVCFAATRRY